jgi:hypothetical protein
MNFNYNHFTHYDSLRPVLKITTIIKIQFYIYLKTFLYMADILFKLLITVFVVYL